MSTSTKNKVALAVAGAIVLSPMTMQPRTAHVHLREAQSFQVTESTAEITRNYSGDAMAALANDYVENNHHLVKVTKFKGKVEGDLKATMIREPTTGPTYYYDGYSSALDRIKYSITVEGELRKGSETIQVKTNFAVTESNERVYSDYNTDKQAVFEPAILDSIAKIPAKAFASAASGTMYIALKDNQMISVKKHKDSLVFSYYPNSKSCIGDNKELEIKRTYNIGADGQLVPKTDGT
jgi:hypothetical protein